MNRLAEINIIFQHPQPLLDYTQLVSFMAIWTTQYQGSQLQNHGLKEPSPVDAVRFSFLSPHFKVHVAQSHLHVQFTPNVSDNQISSFLSNLPKQYQNVFRDIIRQLPANSRPIINGKMFYPFKKLYANIDELQNILHQGLCKFNPLGKTKELKVQMGYEDQNHLFRFIFQNYQMRKLPQPPPTKINLQQFQKYPLMENGLDAVLEVVPLKKEASLYQVIINLIRLFDLTVDAIPVHFLSDLASELKTTPEIPN